MLRLLVTNNTELRGAGCILNIAITTWLVELVGRKTSTRSWRVWLNGVTLVEQALVKQTLEQVPECLDVLIVVCDIRILKIYPVTHLASKITPYTSVLHHILTAVAVVILYGNLLTDILLGNAEALFNTKLYWQTVGIPTRLTVNLKALLGLVTADNILNSTRHYVVNTRHTVS